MATGIAINDDFELTHTVAVIGKHDKAVAWAAVRAGLRVYLRACKSVVRGSIRNEVGIYRLAQSEKIVQGVVGFKRFPRLGDGQNGPHGVYLEHGTKYIAPDHAVANALTTSRGAALAAMRAAIEKKLQQLAIQK